MLLSVVLVLLSVVCVVAVAVVRLSSMSFEFFVFLRSMVPTDFEPVRDRHPSYSHERCSGFPERVLPVGI